MIMLWPAETPGISGPKPAPPRRRQHLILERPDVLSLRSLFAADREYASGLCDRLSLLRGIWNAGTRYQNSQAL